MLIEWCVPTCPDAFRQAVASDRWIRKLVDICRKDDTEQALLRNTVLQLMANWSEWYGNQPACAGFEKAIDMLTDEGFEPPPAAPRESNSQRDGPPSAAPPSARSGVPGLAVPGLQLNLQLNLASMNSNATSQLGFLGNPSQPADGSSKVQAELDIMREDVRTVEKALSKLDSGASLTGFELADAGQAATDARGWQARLSQLLGMSDAAMTHRADNLSGDTMDDMRKLLTQINELIMRWNVAKPQDGRRKKREGDDDGRDSPELLGLALFNRGIHSSSATGVDLSIELTP